MSILSENLKKARRAVNLSQVSAAVVLKIKRSTLASYEEGRATPAPSLIPAIVVLYRIVDWMGFLLENDWDPAHDLKKTDTVPVDQYNDLLKEHQRLLEKLRNLASKC